MIVLHSDLIACRFCNKGSRKFFEKHGLDWATFVKEGIPEEKLLATGDAMALQVVEAARGRRR